MVQDKLILLNKYIYIWLNESIDAINKQITAEKTLKVSGWECYVKSKMESILVYIIGVDLIHVYF